MGFLRSTKGSIISDYFQLQEDIAGFQRVICMTLRCMMIV